VGGLLFLFFFTSLAGSGNHSGLIESVSVSPDGKFLAVEYTKSKNTFIYRVAVDTGHATRLTNAKTGAESSPAFSPDGKRIAFTYSPGNDAPSSIVIGNADGSDLHPWSSPKGDEFWPVFSPDNKTIVFAQSGFFGSYSPIAQPHSHAWSFYAANLDGTNVRQLTNEKFYQASLPSVSPDGKSMLIVTEALDAPPQIAIYSLEHLGKPVQSLRPHVSGQPPGPIFECPNYLPDGKSILFIAGSESGMFGPFDYDVYRLDLATGALERLTKGRRHTESLKVFADGKTAIFLEGHGNWPGTSVKGKLYLLDLQSHKLTPFKVSGLN